MSKKGKQIRLYLVDGSSSGIITVEIMGWTGKIISFPRVSLPEALQRPECRKTGLYFLTGFDENGEELLYIGESDDVATRLKQHEKKEDMSFFEKVAVFVNKDENLTKSHVRYLENRLIDIARNNKTSLKNGNNGAETSLPEADISDMESLIDHLRILLPVLGLHFLQEQLQPNINETNESVKNDITILEMTVPKSKEKATAYQDNNQFIVKAGSYIRDLEHESCSELKHKNGYLKRFEQQYKECSRIDNELPVLKLDKDTAFNSASTAASFVAGSSENGKKKWKVRSTGESYGDFVNKKLETIQPLDGTTEED